MSLPKLLRLPLAASLALCVGGCNDEPSSPSAEGESVADYVASVSVGGTEGTLRTSGIPRPTSGGPSISVDGHLTIVNGGTATLSLTSDAPFETVYVAGSSPISALFIPVSGFFEIPMPVSGTSADVLLTFPQALPSEDFELYFAVGDAEGQVGTVAETPFNALVVGTGDVQVTVSWDSEADVDLHVVDPAGNEIYWADRQSPTGGQLDLDSNAACAGDGVSNENITWGVGLAPQGTYTVRLDYWSNCNASQTKYTVLINNGGTIAIHHGTFTGAGDQGGFGSGILIDTFTRTTGPPPAPAWSRSAQVPRSGSAHKGVNP
ncbi:MAG: YfaP family protein [Candidatus Eiseniibacteriota bacterium]